MPLILNRRTVGHQKEKGIDMPRKSRRKKEKKPGLESWVKWNLNAFREFPVPSCPWVDETAKEFYTKNREEIHRVAKAEGREKALKEWINDMQ